VRIGFVYSGVSNAIYRSIGPADVLARLRNDVLKVGHGADGRIDPAGLFGCDVVHFYRSSHAEAQRLAAKLQAAGVAIVWDNDDDPRLIPPETRGRIKTTKREIEQEFANQLKMLRRADVVTTTSERLAELYRQSGARKVVRIENYLLPWQRSSRRRSHDGLTIGWVAGFEHRADAMALGISDVLSRVLERHHDARVVTVGAHLDIDSPRYEHRDPIPVTELAACLRAFDIGIAPLADIPMTHARSNVKLKEYAGAGLPWIASDRGPYVGMGPSEGGCLVGDGEWEQGLDRLIASRRERRRLRRRGKAWARSQMVHRHIFQWIEVFEEAVAHVADGNAGRAAKAS
jgi:glycosyltransferase involved in cell wall biosynthesis